MEESVKLEVFTYTYTNAQVGKYPDVLLLSDYTTGRSSVELKHLVDNTSVIINRDYIPKLVDALWIFFKEDHNENL